MAFLSDYTSQTVDYVDNKLFDIDDDFMMLILERNICTKVTTLNRINYYRTILFMGNGNGLISYGKSRDLTPEGSLTKAIIECKKISLHFLWIQFAPCQDTSTLDSKTTTST